MCSGTVGWATGSRGSQGQTGRHLVPQVLGGAAYVGIQVRHVDKLGDASFSGCLGNLLRDGHKHILEAIVPVTKPKEVGGGETPPIHKGQTSTLK